MWAGCALPTQAQPFFWDHLYRPSLLEENPVPFETAREQCKADAAVLDPEQEFAIWIRAFISNAFPQSSSTPRNNISYITLPGSIALRFPQSNFFTTDQRHFSRDLSTTARINVRLVFDRSTRKLKSHAVWSDCTFAIDSVDGRVTEIGQARPELELETEVADQQTTYKFSTTASDPLIPEAMLFPVRISARLEHSQLAPKKIEMNLGVSHFPYFEVLLEDRGTVLLLSEIEPEPNRGPFSLIYFSTTPPRSFKIGISLPD